MRILQDENIPKKLKHAFPDYAVAHVTEMGWAGMKNGTLLAMAEGIFDALINGR